MKGFRDFLLRGNVVDLAVAVVIGTAFGALITAFVEAFLTPLVGLATGAAGNFASNGFTVRASRHNVLFPYGRFINALVAFVLIAAAVYFFVVVPVGKLMERRRTQRDVAQETKKCTDCLSDIPIAARRCAFCTTVQAADA